ncbi:hypothetical protein QW180_28780 [Vibrio sinaloensis]|nr:hypothetical protein [Vibrio sinaloensis]
MLRPILPEDEPKHADFINNVSKEDLYKRFFTDVGEFNHEALANLTQIDYDREMAFVAVRQTDTELQIIGVSRALINPEKHRCGIRNIDSFRSQGSRAWQYINAKKVIDYCRHKGTRQMSGMTMPTNRGMLMLAQKNGLQTRCAV